MWNCIQQEVRDVSEIQPKFLSVAPHQVGYTACEGYTLPLSSIGTVVIGNPSTLSLREGRRVWGGGGGSVKGWTTVLVVQINPGQDVSLPNHLPAYLSFSTRMTRYRMPSTRRPKEAQK